jgi:hypothetical protein
MPITVLAGWSVPNAIGQGCLETVDVVAQYVCSLVDDDARQMLPHPLTHNTRLVVINRETFPQ